MRAAALPGRAVDLVPRAGIPLPEEAMGTGSLGLADAERRLERIGAALLAKKAFDVIVCEVGAVSSLADHFVICSGGSRIAVQALADAVRETLAESGVRPLRSEGYAEARWICLDYGDVVVHIFQHDVRRYFDLERLWGDVPQRRLEPEVPLVAGLSG